MLSYRIETWRITTANEHRLIMRPTPKTILNRFAITLLCLIFIATLAYTLHKTSRPRTTTPTPEQITQRQQHEATAQDLARNMIQQGLLSQEEVDAINEKSKQPTTQPRQSFDTTRKWIRRAIYAAIAFFTFIALLAPISILWETVTLSTDVRRQFCIRRRDSIAWVSTKRFPQNAFQTFIVIAREHQEGNRKSGYRTIGWMWEIILQGQNQFPGIIFSVDIFPHPPRENQRIPKKVQTITRAIAAFSGCKPQPGYSVANIDKIASGLFSTKRRYTSRNHPTTHHQTQTMNLQDTPPPLRQKIQQAQARSETGPIQTTKTQTITPATPNKKITYRAPDGTTHTYDSIEDMPPELREIFRDFDNS